MKIELSKKEIEMILNWSGIADCEYTLNKEDKHLIKRLELILKEPCPECHGTGSILNLATQVYIPCKRCKGRGVYREM